MHQQQVQCSNCGGFHVQAREVHFDPLTGQELDSPSEAGQYFVEEHEEHVYQLRHAKLNWLSRLYADLIYPRAFSRMPESRRKSIQRALEKWRRNPQGTDYYCDVCGYRWMKREGEPADEIKVGLGPLHNRGTKA